MMNTLTQADIESITDEEYTRGTARFLPEPDDIPIEYWGWFKGVERNIYFRIAEEMYTGDPVPAGEVSLNPGFTGAGLQRFLIAHMRNVYAEYQHRMAGMAYLMSRVVTITPIKEKP